MSTTTTSVSNISKGSTLRASRRLDHLVRVRDRLAIAVARCQAHRVGNAEEAERLLLAVEDAVHTEFPGMYRRLLDSWLQRDMMLEHTAIQSVQDCAVCGPGLAVVATPALSSPRAA